VDASGKGEEGYFFALGKRDESVCVCVRFCESFAVLICVYHEDMVSMAVSALVSRG